eukprot:3917708-Rhodomonas_salina.2
MSPSPSHVGPGVGDGAARNTGSQAQAHWHQPERCLRVTASLRQPDSSSNFKPMGLQDHAMMPRRGQCPRRRRRKGPRVEGSYRRHGDPGTP